MPTYDTLLFDLDDAGLATVTINRPDKLNALSAQVLRDLDAAMRFAAEDDAVRGVVITGAGEKSFVAGADIGQFDGLSPEGAVELARSGQGVFGQIEAMRKPVVAAVNGFALGGGCELAIACHLRVASETARFGQPEVNLGIIPGYGGTQRLPRLVGLGVATEMILTGAPITAQRALAVGLVNQVVPPGELLGAAKAMLSAITSKGPAAVSLSLDALQTAAGPLEEGLRREAELFGEVFATEDAQEGVNAFLERRKPSFGGK
jgi:enoyl-CoA hydratase